MFLFDILCGRYCSVSAVNFQVNVDYAVALVVFILHDL